MKTKKILIIGLAVLMFASLAGCSSKPVTSTTYDNKYSVDAPKDYKKPASKGGLNANAKLELSSVKNNGQGKYLIMIPYAKASLDMDFDEFFDAFMDSFDDWYPINTVNSDSSKKYGSFDGFFVDVTITYKVTNVQAYLFLVETSDDYLAFMFWSDYGDEYLKEANTIINSLKEL